MEQEMKEDLRQMYNPDGEMSIQPQIIETE